MKYMCLSCAALLSSLISLPSPSMTHFFIHMMSLPVEPSLYTQTHAQTPLASHRLFFSPLHGNGVSRFVCVCTQDTVWRGQQIQVCELLL